MTHKEAAKIKETTDMFGLPIKVGDRVCVFGDRIEGYTEVIETPMLYGLVTEVEVFPTGKSIVTVEHFLYDEETRKDPENASWKDNVETERFWNKSILSEEVLKNVRPEYFL